jgi:hypothetical protein
MASIEKINLEDLNQQKTALAGKAHPVRRAIEALQAGEAIKISVEAFRWRGHTPKLFCNAIAKKHQRQFEVRRPLLIDGRFGMGWIVVRIA